MRMLLPLTLAAAACLFAGAMADEPNGPEIGKPAPGFRLNDHDGRARTLEELRGDGWLVLAFFPKANTGG